MDGIFGLIFGFLLGTIFGGIAISGIMAWALLPGGKS